MAKNILIVESDTGLSRAMREALSARGFSVEETTDGKGCVELVRKSRPELIVLAVDLSAGQNGYIICGKLKGDEDLRAIPVVIIGNSDGFAQHRKLKTKKADDYLAKPFDAVKIVDVVGNLVGMPEPPAQEQEVVEDESLSLSELLTEDDKGGERPAAEDLPTGEEVMTHEETVAGDPDLDMLDSVFDESTTASAPDIAVAEEPIADEIIEEELSVEEDAPDEQKTQIGRSPLAAAPPPPPPPSSPPARSHANVAEKAAASATNAAEHQELLELRSKVTELTGSLEDAKGRAEELDTKVRELESDVESKRTELEASRAGGGKTDKEVFALRDAANKKDKEILRLKNELNEKEKELIELHERENTLDQQVSESSGELARRDAQIKTLTTKSDQLSAERKKIDQALISAKEEARSSGAKLTTLQSELEQIQAKLAGSDAEIEQLRNDHGELESAKQQVDSELSELRAEHEAATAQLEQRNKEADESRSTLEATQIDLDSAKTQPQHPGCRLPPMKRPPLRKRITEMEEKDAKNEERVQQALRAHQDQRRARPEDPRDAAADRHRARVVPRGHRRDLGRRARRGVRLQAATRWASCAPAVRAWVATSR